MYDLLMPIYTAILMQYCVTNVLYVVFDIKK